MAKPKRFVKIEKELVDKLAGMPKEEGERLLERLRYRLHEEKNKILKQAFEEKLITREEYEKSYKDMFYDEFGFDGFIQYIDAVMGSKGDCFVTLNQNLLKRRNELEKKFKLKITSIEELEKIADKQK
ncbi:hypothetical protein J4480_06500 [Candidatus Woesearchaeota archaeon]|nr:hypothetical protein [Candidatus Woesearchaeota archaeon]